MRASVFFSVGSQIYMFEGFQASVAICSEGSDFARRAGRSTWSSPTAWPSFGHRSMWATGTGSSLRLSQWSRIWRPRSYSWELTMVRLFRTQVLVKRGLLAEALRLVRMA